MRVCAGRWSRGGLQPWPPVCCAAFWQAAQRPVWAPFLISLFP